MSGKWIHCRACRVSHRDDLAGIVRAGLIEAEPIAVAPAALPLLGEIEATCAALAREHAGKAPAEIDGLRRRAISSLAGRRLPALCKGGGEPRVLG